MVGLLRYWEGKKNTRLYGEGNNNVGHYGRDGTVNFSFCPFSPLFQPIAIFSSTDNAFRKSRARCLIGAKVTWLVVSDRAGLEYKSIHSVVVVGARREALLLHSKIHRFGTRKVGLGAAPCRLCIACGG